MAVHNLQGDTAAESVSSISALERPQVQKSTGRAKGRRNYFRHLVQFNRHYTE